MFQTLAGESVLQLWSSSDASSAHKEISELPNASVARSPVGLLVLVAHTMAYRTVSLWLNDRQSRWGYHLRRQLIHRVEWWIPDQGCAFKSAQASSKLPYTVVAGVPIRALLVVLVASAIAICTMRVSLVFWECCRHGLVIFRNLVTWERCGTHTKLLLTSGAFLNRRRSLDDGLGRGSTFAVHAVAVNCLSCSCGCWHELSDHVCMQDRHHVWLWILYFNWFLHRRRIVSSLRIVTPSSREGLTL